MSKILLCRAATGPQTKFAKVIFLHLSVILFTGGVPASVHAGIPPPAADTSPGADPPGPDTPPPGAETPLPGAETATAADGTHPTGMHSYWI